MSKAFRDEMTKLGYSVREHKRLMGNTIKSGFRRLSPSARQLLVRGSAEADSGIRHPWLPWNDAQHAFPSVTKKELRRELRITHNDALDSVAKGLADPDIGKTRRNVLITQGLLGVGHSQHAHMDVGSHYDKPLELAKKTGDPSFLKKTKRLRKMIRAMPGYYGGIVSSGLEHSRSGLEYQGITKAPKAELDRLRPSQFKSDKTTVAKSRSYGRAVRLGLMSRLRKRYGLSNREAGKKIDEGLGAFKPSTLERVAGGMLDSVQYAGQQASRLKRLPEVMTERQKYVRTEAKKMMTKVVDEKPS